MLKIALSGCNGRMGQTISKICESDERLKIIAGFDINTEKRAGYPVYSDPFEFSGNADAIIDFSNPESLVSLLKYCKRTKTPLVLCTTGYNEEQIKQIEEASSIIPVFKSGNMSIGVNLIMELLKTMGSVLGRDYDVEVVEKHHNQKLDAPSGTALMLAEAVSSALPYEPEYVYDRHEVRKKRDKKEIGIHSIRGGTIVGEHEVIFAGRDEVIEIKHSIISREVFAVGAVNAAVFLADCREPRIYNMADYVKYKQG
ncbi:MAG: 4-hydroxy-tetrahydrodipicolinate reductase [Bacillota bacterium]|nr:4-hydroxy-tetrahydrodipicolinate reductase [Bacillota bacterium]